MPPCPTSVFLILTAIELFCNYFSHNNVWWQWYCWHALNIYRTTNIHLNYTWKSFISVTRTHTQTHTHIFVYIKKCMLVVLSMMTVQTISGTSHEIMWLWTKWETTSNANQKPIQLGCEWDNIMVQIARSKEEALLLCPSSVIILVAFSLENVYVALMPLHGFAIHRCAWCIGLPDSSATYTNIHYTSPLLSQR